MEVHATILPRVAQRNRGGFLALGSRSCGSNAAAKRASGFSDRQRTQLRARQTARSRVARKAASAPLETDGGAAPGTPQAVAPEDPVSFVNEQGFREQRQGEVPESGSFLCVSCEYVYMDSERCAIHKKRKGNDVSCSVCMAVYKKTAMRWLRDRSLQTWFP